MHQSRIAARRLCPLVEFYDLLACQVASDRESHQLRNHVCRPYSWLPEPTPQALYTAFVPMTNGPALPPMTFRCQSCESIAAPRSLTPARIYRERRPPAAVCRRAGLSSPPFLAAAEQPRMIIGLARV